MTPDTYHGRTIAEWHAYAAALSVELEQCKAELRHANKENERLRTAIQNARDRYWNGGESAAEDAGEAMRILGEAVALKGATT